MNAFFRHVLVPVDLSDRNGPALAMAAELARGDGARITLLHVIETILDLPVDDARTFYDQIEERARARLAEWAGGLGPGARAEILYGPRAREIVGYASDSGADLILLRSHRIDPASPAQGWATLSYQVAVLAHCPVLLVK